MKTMRKLLSMILAVMMLFSCVTTAVFADEEDTTKGFSDVSDDQIYSNAVSTLNLMGIINGYPDGSFGPDKNVTRAEFTAMLMRTLNLGSVGSATAEGLPFTDVDAGNSDISWAIPNINTAYGMGVINGYEDATFRPSANVAFEEAVKMIVCTLGYGDNVDVSTNPWYANYISIANQIGVTKTANSIGSPSTPATRACIAQLLFDSLEIKLVKNGERTSDTILKDYLGFTKCTGIISSNGVTSLSSPDVNLRSNEIQIYAMENDSYEYETHTYKTTDETLKNYLGYEVEFYYIEDGVGDRTLMFCVLQNNEPFVLNASLIEERDTDAYTISYYTDRTADKENEISLDDNNVVVYNGKLYGRNDRESRFADILDDNKLPEVGQITLIDSDENGRYDFIDIAAYEIYYVSNKDTANVTIIDNIIADASNKTLYLDVAADRNLSIVNKSGKEVLYSSIATGNIICLAKSNSGNGSPVVTKAVVLTDKVTGKVTAINGDGSITIDGKDYHYSKAAPWMSGGTTLEQPQLQDSGTYYLDSNGDIVAYSKNASTENVKYGYILGYYEESDSFDADVEFRVFTSTGADEYIKTYKNTTVDGTPCETGAEVVSALEATATNPGTGRHAVQQLVKYTTKSVGGNTVFAKIITATKVAQGAELETGKLTTLSALYDGEGAPKSMTYNSSSKVLVSGDSKINIGSATVISVPEERDSYDDFMKTTVSTSFKNTNSYTVEMFDLSKANVPKIVVVYGADNSQPVNALSPVYVVDTKDEATKGDELMHRIGVYKSTETSASSSSNVWVSDSSDSPADIQPGDIFRAGFDKYGDTLVQDSYMIYEMGETATAGIVTEGEDSDDITKAEFATIIGSVVATDEVTLSVADEFFTAEQAEAGEYDTTKATNFNISDFDDALVLIYDTTGQNFKIKVGEYESVIASFTTYTDKITPSKILIYMTEGKIKLLCVLPQ